MATIYLNATLLCWFLIVPATNAIANGVGQTFDGEEVSAAETPLTENPAWFQLPEIGVGDIVTVALFAALLLTVYSLLTTGKRGWGWMVVGFIASVIAIIGKGILSVFVEITSEYCPPDWDED